MELLGFNSDIRAAFGKTASLISAANNLQRRHADLDEHLTELDNLHSVLESIQTAGISQSQEVSFFEDLVRREVFGHIFQDLEDVRDLLLTYTSRTRFLVFKARPNRRSSNNFRKSLLKRLQDSTLKLRLYEKAVANEK